MALQGRDDPTKPATMNDQVRADFADFGVAVPEEQDEDMTEVWDINAPTLNLFLAVQGQWRCVPMMGFGGGRLLWLGLDYAAVDVAMKRGRVADKSGEIFAGLQVMELAAVQAFSEEVN